MSSKTLRDAAQVLLAAAALALFLKIVVVGALAIPSSSMENTLLVGDFVLINKFVYGAQTPPSFPFRLRFPSLRAPQCGDVIAFRFDAASTDKRGERGATFVKRCVAVPGDTLLIVRGGIVVNRRQIVLPATAKSSPHGEATQGSFGPIIVPRAGQTVVLGPTNLDQWKQTIEAEGHSVSLADSGSVYIDGTRSTSYDVRRNYYFVVGDNINESMDSRSFGFIPEESIVGKVMMVYWSWDGEKGSWTERVRWRRIGILVH